MHTFHTHAPMYHHGSSSDTCKHAHFSLNQNINRGTSFFFSPPRPNFILQLFLQDASQSESTSSFSHQTFSQKIPAPSPGHRKATFCWCSYSFILGFLPRFIPVPSHSWGSEELGWMWAPSSYANVTSEWKQAPRCPLWRKVRKTNTLHDAHFHAKVILFREERIWVTLVWEETLFYFYYLTNWTKTYLYVYEYISTSWCDITPMTSPKTVVRKGVSGFR